MNFMSNWKRKVAVAANVPAAWRGAGISAPKPIRITKLKI